MTVHELREALDRMVALDARRDDAEVTCGTDFQPVNGGAFGHAPRSGALILNLSPMKLDLVGGF